MSVDPAYIAELQRALAASPDEDTDDSSMSALATVTEVLAYTIEHARYSGWPEADAVETLVRMVELPPDEVRACEHDLRPLGYRDVCARLRQITGRRKHSLVPLP